MSFPAIFRRLFQKEGAGPLLRKEIIPPHADTHGAKGGDPIDITALGGVSAEAFMVLQKLFDNHVKKKLTKETVFYVNGETGSDALDDGRGLSESKPFRTAQAAINHICGSFDLFVYPCFLELSERVYPEFLTIPQFDTLTGQLRIRGAGASKTFIDGSILARNAYGLVAIEPSLTVRCPGKPTPGWINSWYGVASFAAGVVEVGCTVDAGDVNPSLYKYCVSGSQLGGEISLAEGCALVGNCTNFLSTIGASIDMGSDITINGTIVGSGAVAAARQGGRFIVFTKPDGVSFPAILGKATGVRHYADTGGGFSVAGQGPDFFPGTEPGIVDTATGGYYG